MRKRLAVLVSGRGTLLQAMLDQKMAIELVIADRPCAALEIANKARDLVQCTALLARRDRIDLTRVYIEMLQAQGIQLVALAGFRTILGSQFFEAENYLCKVLNCHPSLLPAFKGLGAVRQAIKQGVKVTGCTIHLATHIPDDGPILAQEPVKVLPGDTVESLTARIQQVERELYPMIIRTLRG